MFSVQKVKNEIQSLYRYGMDAVGYSKTDVESMLKTIDFAALTQALRHNSETVYSIFVDGDLPDMLRHRGRELFGERAARIYVDNVLPDSERLEKRVTDGNLVFRRGNGLFEGYSRELWLPEHGPLVTSACMTHGLFCASGWTLTMHREAGRYPWDSEIRLNLAELTNGLNRMCAPVHKGEYPLYEL